MMVLQLIDICRHFLMQRSLKVPPQYFESGSGLDLGCAIASTWFFNPSNLYSVLCLGSLSCWMTHPGFRRQSDGRRFYYRILWYTKEFDSVTERCLGHTAEKQAHPITPPLPCLAASKVLVLNYCICFFATNIWVSLITLHTSAKLPLYSLPFHFCI